VRLVRVTRGRHDGRDECGTSMVQFALILPLFMMLVLGMLTGGASYNRQLGLTHAALEGARYGATLPVATPGASFVAAPCGGQTWAAAVQSTVVGRSAGALACDQVCAALVTGLPGAEAVVTQTATTVSTGDRICYHDASGTDPGKRVQVCVDRDPPAAPPDECVNGAAGSSDKLEVLFFSVGLRLHARATARFGG